MYHYCGVTSKCCYSPDFHSCYQSSLYVDQVKKEQPPSTWGSHMAMGKEIRIAARKNITGYKAHSWRHCCKINMFEQFQQVTRCLSLLLLHVNLKHYRMLFVREDIGKLPSSPPIDLNTQTQIIRISKFCNWHPEPQEEILIKTIGTFLSWNWPFFCCWLRICVILCHKDPQTISSNIMKPKSIALTSKAHWQTVVANHSDAILSLRVCANIWVQEASVCTSAW